MPERRPRMLQLGVNDYAFRMHLAPVMRAFEDRGFEVWGACASGPHFRDLQREGLRLEPIPFTRDYDLRSHRRCYAALVALIRRLRPAVVHTHTVTAGLIGRLAARRCGVPCVVHTAHGFHFHEGSPTAAWTLHFGLERAACAATDLLLLQSEEDRETATRLRMLPRRAMVTIGNGIDLRRFNPAAVAPEESAVLRSSLGFDADDVVAIYVGRLTRDKGLAELAEAMKRAQHSNPRLRLLLVLSRRDDERHQDEALLRALTEVPGVRLLFGRKDVPALLSASDFFVLPSWYEGVPRAAMEALAMGRPVLASRVRGNREVVRPGINGLLFTVRDCDGLTGALLQLAASPALRERMGLAAIRDARRRFDEQHMLRRQVEAVAGLWETEHARSRRPDPRCGGRWADLSRAAAFGA